MTKTFDEYAREWQGNAEADALWVILTDPNFYGRKWDIDAFFATGEEEISRVFAYLHRTQVQIPSGVFLDFGCGVGRISRALQKRFGQGFGVDISPKMIELARTYVPGVDFLVNQTPALSMYQDGSIDFVYSHIVLQHIPARFQSHYIEEFLRILRPGGLAVFQVPIGIINPQQVKPPVVSRIKQGIKQAFPFLIALKRWLMPPEQVHYEFRYEMHPLPDAEIRMICKNRECSVEAASATNSCEPDHNGRIEFYELDVYRKQLENSGLPNRYLSCMYCVRKPFPG